MRWGPARARGTLRGRDSCSLADVLSLSQPPPTAAAFSVRVRRRSAVASRSSLNKRVFFQLPVVRMIENCFALRILKGV